MLAGMSGLVVILISIWGGLVIHFGTFLFWNSISSIFPRSGGLPLDMVLDGTLVGRLVNLLMRSCRSNKHVLLIVKRFCTLYASIDMYKFSIRHHFLFPDTILKMGWITSMLILWSFSSGMKPAQALIPCEMTF